MTTAYLDAWESRPICLLPFSLSLIHMLGPNILNAFVYYSSYHLSKVCYVFRISHL